MPATLVNPPRTRARSRALRVVVAGAGFAALEALAALHELAEERVAVTIVSPTRQFAYRPAAPAAAFGDAEVQSFDIAGIAADLGATSRFDAIEAVVAGAHRVRTSSGGYIEYDALVLAAGARRRAAVPGALTFRHEQDVDQVREVFRRASRGAVRSVAFVVPSGTTWSLPAYELALDAATWRDRHAPGLRIALVTAERSPLAVLGDVASAAVARVVREARVDLFTDTRARGLSRDKLTLEGHAIDVDAAIATPRLEGVRFRGVPSDYSGFAVTDALGAVDGLDDVYAVGDLSGYPIKQGGLAAQEADAVASALAAQAGASVAVKPPTRTLRVRVSGVEEPLFLTAELDSRGRPRPGTSTVETVPPWWPPAKVYARHLSPYLARHGQAHLAITS